MTATNAQYQPVVVHDVQYVRPRNRAGVTGSRHRQHRGELRRRIRRRLAWPVVAARFGSEASD